MKNYSTFLVPVAVLLVVFAFFKLIFASGPVNPILMGGILVVSLVGSLLLRPKNNGNHRNTDTTLSLLGDYSKDAFSYDAALSAQFQGAVSDFLNSMPKAATKKLENLQPLCKTDADTYAVSVTLGMIKASNGDYSAAIKLFNRAVILHPTAELADTIGSAHQRIGELEEAMDSYEFALDLDPENIDIRAKLATACVADGKLEEAIEQAQLVLDLREDHASALATIAICHGILGNDDLYSGYTARAVEAGYQEQKITATVPVLKKKFKR
jgi:tetratricopeptide (TPR) repeat protein